MNQVHQYFQVHAVTFFIYESLCLFEMFNIFSSHVFKQPNICKALTFGLQGEASKTTFSSVVFIKNTQKSDKKRFAYVALGRNSRSN